MALYAVYKDTDSTTASAGVVIRFTDDNTPLEVGELFLLVADDLNVSLTYYVKAGVLYTAPAKPNVYSTFDIDTETWVTDADVTTLLAAPTLTVTAGINLAYIDFPTPTDPLFYKYMLFRANTSDFIPSSENLIYQGVDNMVDEGLNPDLEYFYKAAAATIYEDDPAVLSISSAYPLRYAPDPVTGLSSTGGVKQITLNWTATASITDDYQIWRNTTNTIEGATLLDTVESNSYVDTTPVTGTEYYYWVIVVSYFGDLSSPSDPTGPVSTSAVVGDDIGELEVSRTKITNGAITEPFEIDETFGVPFTVFNRDATYDTPILIGYIDIAIDGSEVNVPNQILLLDTRSKENTPLSSVNSYFDEADFYSMKSSLSGAAVVLPSGVEANDTSGFPLATSVTPSGHASDTLQTIDGIEYRVIEWTGDGSLAIDSGYLFGVQYLIIGGGGGGGGGAATANGGGGGGGGAGAFLTNINKSSLFPHLSDNIKIGDRLGALSGITTLTVDVGAGGAGGATDTNGVNGSTSSITATGYSVIAEGGGGGGGGRASSGLNGNSRVSASTGGGGSSSSIPRGFYGTCDFLGVRYAFEGFQGGSGDTSSRLGGGGGGAGYGGIGGNGGGDGGNGRAINFNGTEVTLAGGGGGGKSSAGTNGLGSAGGGNGGTSAPSVGGNATANTGSGGGGGGNQRAGGNGGSGKVVIRWPTNQNAVRKKLTTTLRDGEVVFRDISYSGTWFGATADVKTAIRDAAFFQPILLERFNGVDNNWDAGDVIRLYLFASMGSQIPELSYLGTEMTGATIQGALIYK